MEGVPRIQMVSFPMKRSGETPNFKGRLRPFILEHYNEEPESYSQEINELESLRAGAVHISRDYTGCSTLKKYICQLNFLKSRFPLHEGSPIAISFSWFDVYSETAHGWSDIDFEMSCILYNIGALHSELGALDSRQTVDGMKTSCTHFQCAAWAFQHLRHNYQKFFTPDVSADALSIITNICLAQAQECVLEKSLVENRKSTITAKVSLQIVEYYQLALKTSDQLLKDASQYSDKLVKAVKKWRKLVELKVSYYQCLSYLYRGLQAEDDSKWGERVTFYKVAVDKLNEAIKSSKSLEKTDTIHETLAFTLDVVAGKLSVSEKENEFVYHEKVPELDSIVSDIKGVSLVKGIPFKFDDPEIAGPDIFGRLVPMEAHEASSLYSEKKAEIMRTYSQKIEEKNESLDKFLIALNLEQLDLHSEENKVPQELVDCCAALSVNQGAVQRLSDEMSTLSGMYHDTEANLQEILQLLKDQETKEKEFQDIVGKRHPSNVITELSREVHKYQSGQTIASESNQTLHAAMSQHVANLNILMKPLDEVMKHIPKTSLVEETDREAVHDMKRLIAKIDEMRKQREMLECQLRDSIHKDDITKQLVVKKDQDLDLVFQEELQKHYKITQILDQNLLAQENIIRAMTETNANYASTRKSMISTVRKRDEVIQSFLSSYDAYDELLSKCNKGIDFYKKLDANVNKLLQRVKGVCKVQDEEREQAMQSVIKKSHASMPLNNVSGNNYMGAMSPAGMDSVTPQPKLKDYLNAMNASKNISKAVAAVDNSASVPSDSSYGAVAQQSMASQHYNQQTQWGYNTGYQVQPSSAGSNLQQTQTAPTPSAMSQSIGYPAMQNYQTATAYARNPQTFPADSGQSKGYDISQQTKAGIYAQQQQNWNYPSYPQSQPQVSTQTSIQQSQVTTSAANNSTPSPLSSQTSNYPTAAANYQSQLPVSYGQQTYAVPSDGQNAMRGQGSAYNSTQSQMPVGYGAQSVGYGYDQQQGYSAYQTQTPTAVIQPQPHTTPISVPPTVPSTQTASYAVQNYPNSVSGTYTQQHSNAVSGQNGISGGGYSYNQSVPQQQQSTQISHTYNQPVSHQTKPYIQNQSNQSYGYGVNTNSTLPTSYATNITPNQSQQGYTGVYSNKTNETPASINNPYTYSYSQQQYQPQTATPQSQGGTVPANYGYYAAQTTTYGQGQTQLQNQQQYYNQMSSNMQQQTAQQSQNMMNQQAPQLYNQPASAPHPTSVVNNNNHNISNNVRTNQSNVDLLSSIDFGAPNVEPLAPTPVNQTADVSK